MIWHTASKDSGPFDRPSMAGRVLFGPGPPQSKVYPSGAALAAKSVPMAPPPPGFSSMTKGCSMYFGVTVRTARINTSVALPGPNGITRVTGFVGYCWADAACRTNTDSNNAQKQIQPVFRTFSLITRLLLHMFFKFRSFPVSHSGKGNLRDLPPPGVSPPHFKL